MTRKSITRNHRSLFVLMIDQSGSMAEFVGFRGERCSKATVVSHICNSSIQELILRARRDEGVRDYYDVLVLGYSGEGVVEVLGLVDGSPYISVRDLEALSLDCREVSSVVNVADGSSSLHSRRIKRWVMPKSSGSTPMHESLTRVYELVKEWIESSPDAYPPIVFNITDGITSDCDLCDLSYISDEIKSLRTTQGEVLLMNIHISQSSQEADRVVFPTQDDMKMNRCQYYKALYDTASYMPEEFNDHICKHLKVSKPAKGCQFKGLGYNTSFSDIFTMLNIGSISVRRS
ncbi:MAG: VWA domain-containing protein [Rikenellaceae bacterium]